MSQYDFSSGGMDTPSFHPAISPFPGSGAKSIRRKLRSFLSACCVAVPLTAAFCTPAWATAYTTETDLQNALNAAAPGGTVDISGSSSIDLDTALVIPEGVVLTNSSSVPVSFVVDSNFTGTPVPTDPNTAPLLMTRTYTPMIIMDSGSSLTGNIVIDGATTGSTPSQIDGIYSYLTQSQSVTISGVTVQNLTPAYTGNGTGNGIIIVGAGDATITGDTITNFAKNGIDFASTGDLTANNNKISNSPNPSKFYAQNGILVRGGNAALNGNTISGMQDSTRESACILVIGGDVTGSGDNLSNCDVGVSADDSYLGQTGVKELTVDLENTVLTGNGTPTSSSSGIQIFNVNAPRAVPATVTPVPTVSESALVALGLMLAALAAVKLRRRNMG